MPITLVLKRSAVAGDVPQATDMTQGELVLNSADNSVYHKTPSDQVRDIIQARISATLSVQSGNTAWLFSGDAYPQTAADPTLYVYRGLTYRFDNRANNSTHPFQLTLENGTSYTSGFTSHASGMITWTVPMDAPDTLLYRCPNFAAMSGTIRVGSNGLTNSDQLPEGTTNLYFTNARARNAISVSGSLSYNSSTGVVSYTAPTPSLATLSDVTVGQPGNGQALLYNTISGKWAPGTVSTTTSLAALTDVQIGTPTNGQALVWNSTSNKWVPGAVTGGGGSGTTVTVTGPVAAQRAVLDSIASQFNGTLTTFNLTNSSTAYTPQDALALEVILGGIQQRPTVDYTVSGSAITFTDAPAAGLTCLIVGTTYTSALFNRTTITQSISLASLAFGNIEINAGKVFNILSIGSDNPAWIRVYGDTATRDADSRSNPGGTLPAAGTAYFAEVTTSASSPTVRFSPVPVVQCDGTAYIRVQNRDLVTRTLNLTFVVTVLEY